MSNQIKTIKMSYMKSALPLIAMSILAMQPGTEVRNRYYEGDVPINPTDAQRRMFKQPVKLNKKQKAKRRSNK